MADIYIQVGNNNVIRRIHHTPFDPTYGLQRTREELSKTGFFVDSIPEATVVPGKIAVAKYNPDTNTVYYDYEDAPMSSKERLDNLEMVMNDVLLGGLM